MKKNKRLTKKDFDLIRFPNGEVKVIGYGTFTGEIQWKYGGEFKNGKANLSPSEELIILMQLNKLVEKVAPERVKLSPMGKLFEEFMDKNELPTTKVQKLYADFLPFKRQDKDKLLGEVKFNDIYETLKFLDLHEVAPHDSDTFAEYALELYSKQAETFEYVVFPDCGAQERFKNYDPKLKLLSVKDLVEDNDGSKLPEYQKITVFNKSRNANTGKVEFEKFEGKIKGKAIIFDDIISYGGTFKHVATELKKAGASYVKLVVNHSDGVYDVKDMKKNGIDEIVILNGGFE